MLNLIRELEYKLKSVRNTLNYLRTYEFKSVFDSLNKSERSELENLITKGNYRVVKRFIKTRRDLDLFSVKELRYLGSQYRISDYHLMRKQELIDAIREYKRIA